MAQTWSIFDVIGPVMVGPSSSHTAGACFIGLMARQIFGTEPKEVLIKLHGSFGEVFKGHCTDIAVLGGLLNMAPHDPRIADSIKIAKKNGIKVTFESCNLGPDLHPNTALIIMKSGKKEISVQGSSLGGGKAEINMIDKIQLRIGSERSSLIVNYDNSYNIIAEIISAINTKNYQIVEIDTPNYKDRSIAIVTIKEYFTGKIIPNIEKIKGVIWASYNNHFSHYNQEY